VAAKKEKKSAMLPKVIAGVKIPKVVREHLAALAKNPMVADLLAAGLVSLAAKLKGDASPEGDGATEAAPTAKPAKKPPAKKPAAAKPAAAKAPAKPAAKKPPAKATAPKAAAKSAAKAPAKPAAAKAPAKRPPAKRKPVTG
jgi:hypothetical protein